MIKKSLLTTLCFILCITGSTGCTTTSTQNGALLGTLLGAGAGAIIGNQSGNQGEGALIGAAAGALLGAIAGDQADQRRRTQQAQSGVTRQPVQRSAAAPAANKRQATQTAKAPTPQFGNAKVRTASGEIKTVRVWNPASGGNPF